MQAAEDYIAEIKTRLDHSPIVANWTLINELS